MPNMNISIPHHLSQDEALKRIQDAIAQAKAENPGKIKDFQENWNGNVGTFRGSGMGQTASGTITVSASEIVLDLELPFAATFFKAQIEENVRKFAAGLLG
jgi:hypothetical protein